MHRHVANLGNDINLPEKGALHFVSLFFLWCALMSVSPFVFDHAIFGNMIKPLFAIFFFLSAFFLLLKKNIYLPFQLYIPFCQILFFFAYFVVKVDGFYSALLLRLFFVCGSMIIIHNIFGWKMFIKSFINIMIVFAVLGVIGFFLGLAGFKPLSTFQNPDTRTAFNYFFTFSNAVLNVGGIDILRVASYFDEPGTFGFFLVFAILCNRLLDFSVKKEFVFIVGGLFTFSLAFYVLIFLYLLLFYFSYKNIGRLFLFSIILMLFFSIIHYKQDDSPTWKTLHRITLGRLERIEGDTSFVGDNRSELLKKAYDLWQKEFFWGGSPSVIFEKHGFYGANILAPLADHGFIGGIVYFLPIIYATLVSIMKRNRKYVFIVVILWLQYFQRPNLSALFEYLCILFIINLFNDKERNQPVYFN